MEQEEEDSPRTYPFSDILGQEFRLVHPSDYYSYNEEYGTWMEINNRHGCLTVEGIKQAAKYDVTFIIGSDAHIPGDVGHYDEALGRAIEAGLDLSRIVNLRQE